MTNKEVGSSEFSRKMMVKFAKAIILVVCIAQCSLSIFITCGIPFLKFGIEQIVKLNIVLYLSLRHVIVLIPLLK